MVSNHFTCDLSHLFVKRWATSKRKISVLSLRRKRKRPRDNESQVCSAEKDETTDIDLDSPARPPLGVYKALTRFKEQQGGEATSPSINVSLLQTLWVSEFGFGKRQTRRLESSNIVKPRSEVELTLGLGTERFIRPEAEKRISVKKFCCLHYILAKIKWKP